MATATGAGTDEKKSRKTIQRHGVPSERRIFVLPPRLARVLDDACLFYDLSQSEMMRRILIAFAVDVAIEGPVWDFLNGLFDTFAEIMDQNPSLTYGEYAQMAPGSSGTIAEAIEAGEVAADDLVYRAPRRGARTHTEADAANYLANNLDTHLPFLSAVMEMRTRERASEAKNQDIEQEAGAA